MKVILSNKTAEIIEKKSRFIADVKYVQNEDEAISFINDIKKKYYDAKHHTFAYKIGINTFITKVSDDGEPSGTAGRPMLDIINGNDYTNIVVVVTRYFGGTLLGVGGLLRAYSDSLKLALENIQDAEIISGYKCGFCLSYDEYGKFTNLLSTKYIEKNICIETKKEFNEKILLEYLVDENKYVNFEKDIIDLTRGREKFDIKNKVNYFVKSKSIEYIE